MKKIHFLALILAFLGNGMPSFAQEYLVNGSFENASTFSGWVTSGGDGSLQTAVSPNVSPFGSSYGVSTKSALFVDGATRNGGPELRQEFASASNAPRLSFDFKLASFAADYWQMFPAFSEGGNTFFLANIWLGEAGNFVFQSGHARFAAPLSAGSWYHVEVDFDFGTQQMSGSITEFSGNTLTWAGHSFIQTLASLNTILVDDAVDVAAKNGDLLLDNLSVRGPSQVVPVPEPSVYGVVASLLLASVVWARRFRSHSSEHSRRN